MARLLRSCEKARTALQMRTATRLHLTAYKLCKPVASKPGPVQMCSLRLPGKGGAELEDGAPLSP